MSTDLKRRLAKIESGIEPPSILGDFAHRDGVPTQHNLSAEHFDLQAWFRTGGLPKDAAFFVSARPEDDLKPGGYEYHPFPPLHPNALKVLCKIMTFCEMAQENYNFDGHQFRGVGGVLPPDQQVKELMPHG